MKKEIKLNNYLGVDLEKLIEGGMVILANSGGGKSYAIRRIAEQAVPHVQVIILDPEGEFASLREKFDFILCGKDKDVPVEVRSSSLLATKLLELNKSAVIDLYELHPQERQRYVKNFCDALVNCPKELYHPVLIILDEAHEYVPEGKPSEATWAVESLASKGRKRGQRLILASQRISKLSKNASAEANNKLIGRASQDIDMKRAGDELGFSKEKLVQLRQLKPGEFFVFGSAISDDVQKIKIGEVKTHHAKVGYQGKATTPPPSSVIKKVLGELKDLPQEAEKEAKTVAELKKENAELKRKNTLLENRPQGGLDQKEIDRQIKAAVKEAEDRKEEEFFQERNKWLEQISNWFKIIKDIGEAMTLAKKEWEKGKSKKIMNSPVIQVPVKSPVMISRTNSKIDPDVVSLKDTSLQSVEVSPLGTCEKKVYTFLYNNPDRSFSKIQLGAVTGYSPTSGGFNNALSKLNTLGLIERGSEGIRVGTMSVPSDYILEGEKFSAEPQFWSNKLGACERKIYETLWNDPEGLYPKDHLGNITGYSSTSGGFNNALSRLNTLGLIRRVNGMIQLNPELLSL